MLIGSIDKTKPITIYGAGFSGLLAGYYLKKQGCQVQILEISSRAAGLLQTKQTAFGPAEGAANGILLHDELIELTRELKLNLLYSKPKLKRKLYRHGKLTSFSILTILPLLKNLFSKKFTQSAEVFEKMTVLNFFSFFIGEKATKETILIALQGIYGNHLEDLHFQSIFPLSYSHVNGKNLFQVLLELKKSIKKQQAPKTTVSFQTGMHELTQKLTEYLQDDLHFNISSDQLKENAILTCDAINAAKLCDQSFPEIAKELRLIRYGQLSSITIFIKNLPSQLKNSFGVLFSEQNSIKGILCNSEIFANRVKGDHHSLTLIGNGEKMIVDFEKLFPCEILHVQSFRYEKALPVYDYHRFVAVEKIKKMIEKRKMPLAFFGNYTGSISLRGLHQTIKKI